LDRLDRDDCPAPGKIPVLVVCCDGTGNEFVADNNSNVVKLYSTLVINADQRAYYHPGVDTMSQPGETGEVTALGALMEIAASALKLSLLEVVIGTAKLLFRNTSQNLQSRVGQLAFGSGILEIVRSAYAFLMSTYEETTEFFYSVPAVEHTVSEL